MGAHSEWNLGNLEAELAALGSLLAWPCVQRAVVHLVF